MKKPKSYTAAELKSDFSSIVAELKQGHDVDITYGRNKELLGRITPASKLKKPDYSVETGDLERQGWTFSMHNFEMTEEEFLGE
jgi:antitoxin (DNA-binding transcriptional repressor) of toxin-antitoxin stability system